MVRDLTQVKQAIDQKVLQLQSEEITPEEKSSIAESLIANELKELVQHNNDLYDAYIKNPTEGNKQAYQRVSSQIDEIKKAFLAQMEILSHSELQSVEPELGIMEKIIASFTNYFINRIKENFNDVVSQAKTTTIQKPQTFQSIKEYKPFFESIKRLHEEDLTTLQKAYFEALNSSPYNAKNVSNAFSAYRNHLNMLASSRDNISSAPFDINAYWANLPGINQFFSKIYAWWHGIKTLDTTTLQEMQTQKTDEFNKSMTREISITAKKLLEDINTPQALIIHLEQLKNGQLQSLGEFKNALKGLDPKASYFPELEKLLQLSTQQQALTSVAQPVNLSESTDVARIKALATQLIEQSKSISSQSITILLTKISSVESLNNLGNLQEKGQYYGMTDLSLSSETSKNSTLKGYPEYQELLEILGRNSDKIPEGDNSVFKALKEARPVATFSPLTIEISSTASTQATVASSQAKADPFIDEINKAPTESKEYDVIVNAIFETDLAKFKPYDMVAFLYHKINNDPSINAVKKERILSKLTNLAGHLPKAETETKPEKVYNIEGFARRPPEKANLGNLKNCFKLILEGKKDELSQELTTLKDATASLMRTGGYHERFKPLGIILDSIEEKNKSPSFTPR